MATPKHWRLALSTSRGPIYEPHDTRSGAEASADEHADRLKSTSNQVTRIHLEQWLTDTRTWVYLGTLWPSPTDDKGQADG